MATKRLEAPITQTSAREIQKVIDQVENDYEPNGWSLKSLEIEDKNGVPHLVVRVEK